MDCYAQLSFRDYLTKVNAEKAEWERAAKEGRNALERALAKQNEVHAKVQARLQEMALRDAKLRELIQAVYEYAERGEVFPLILAERLHTTIQGNDQ